jgi:hypothetical protein
MKAIIKILNWSKTGVALITGASSGIGSVFANELSNILGYLYPISFL